MKKRAKWIWGGIGFSLFLFIILIYLFRVTILTCAGQFMAPTGNFTADAAILEGSEFIDRSVIACGVNLFSSGRVKRLVVILHRIDPLHRPFAISGDYPNNVKKEMDAAGLKEKDFRIIVTHIHHPVTLIEATGVLKDLAKDDIKSAILVSPGFHTRRSFLVYQYLGILFGIKVFPCACFNSYHLDHWWSQETGAHDFAAEFLKLVYYLAKGYIPLRFSYPL